jgi:hypothetical protein
MANNNTLYIALAGVAGLYIYSRSQTKPVTAAAVTVSTKPGQASLSLTSAPGVLSALSSIFSSPQPAANVQQAAQPAATALPVQSPVNAAPVSTADYSGNQDDSDLGGDGTYSNEDDSDGLTMNGLIGYTRMGLFGALSKR